MKIVRIKVYGITRTIRVDPSDGKPRHVASERRESTWIVNGKLVRRRVSRW